MADKKQKKSATTPKSVSKGTQKAASARRLARQEERRAKNIAALGDNYNPNAKKIKTSLVVSWPGGRLDSRVVERHVSMSPSRQLYALKRAEKAR